MKQIAFAFHNDLPARGYQSEAERHFLAGLVEAGWLQNNPANDNDDRELTWWHPQFKTTFLFAQLDLEPLIGVQHQVDYCFQTYAPLTRSLVVEIDGHSYHSRPEQLARDKRFDRAIQANGGWSVFRYPAREVLDARLRDQSVRMIHSLLTRWSRAPVAARVS